MLEQRSGGRQLLTGSKQSPQTVLLAYLSEEVGEREICRHLVSVQGRHIWDGILSLHLHGLRQRSRSYRHDLPGGGHGSFHVHKVDLGELTFLHLRHG